MKITNIVVSKRDVHIIYCTYSIRYRKYGDEIYSTLSRTGDGSIQNLKYDVRIGSDFGSCFGF